VPTLEQSDLFQLCWITGPNPETLEARGVGPLLISVLLAVNNERAAPTRNAQAATIEAPTFKECERHPPRKCAAAADPEL
jgi:hypothetical protein